MLGNAVSVSLPRRLGRALPAAGVAVLLVSLGTIALLVAWLGTGLTTAALLAPAVGFGLGMGAVLNALLGSAMSQVPPEQAGTASGLVNTTIQVGTATGIALLGTVFFSRLGHGYPAATATALGVSIGVLVLALLLTAVLPRIPRPEATTAPSPTAHPSIPAEPH